jgi:carbamoyltransferase
VNVLGISCYYHDSAAALIQDGLVTAASEEERLSRVKHDPRFPTHAVRFCLEQGGISAADLDWVVFYEKPFTKFERVLSTCVHGAPRTWNIFQESSLAWLKEKLWVRDHICHRLGVPASKVLFVDHHVSHAASAFFCSPFREAAVLTVDGVGEWATATMGTATADWDGKGSNSIHLTHELRFPHSLGLLYSAFTAFLGFQVNEGEYKVMGMGAYGQPRYIDRIHKIAHLAGDGSLWLDMRYFRYHQSARNSFSGRFVDLFGEPRDASEPFAVSADENSAQSTDLLRRCQFYADVAASIQAFTEETLLRMARHLRATSGKDALCIAGGVALNSVANARIAREAGFTQMFIQPAAGDSGGALGAALYAYHVLLGKPRRYTMEHAFLGAGEASSSVPDFVRGLGVKFTEYDDTDRLAADTAAEIADGKVVGWFQGRSEWGARALGNRSILADPRRAEMKDIVNTKIKFREPFRPFAPVVPEDRAAELFDCPPDVLHQYPARFMLYVMPWKENCGERVPAVNHCGTGRLQTLRPEWNPRYYSVLEYFHQATGIPVLLNTSFNLRGEPIVCTPADAWKTFQNSGLDLMVLDRFLVRK